MTDSSLRRPSASSISPTCSATNNERAIPQSSWNSAIMASPDSLVAEIAPACSVYGSLSKLMVAMADHRRNPTDLRLPDTLISEGIALYFSNHCNQPCPVLSQFISMDLHTNNPLPSIILYPLLALSLRSSQSTSLGDRQRKREWLDTIAQHSWNLLTKAYCTFDLDDTYLQGLCLLAQVDAGGELVRSSL